MSAPPSVSGALSHALVRALGLALAERPGREAEVYEGARLAAVALLLREAEEGGIELLLVKRAEWEGDPWSGHVALPGGRREPEDDTLEDTAARETWEEIALDVRRDGALLGTLDDLSPRTPVLPPIIVRPYVYVVARGASVAPSPELQAAFWVPLAQLRDPSLRTEASVVVRGVERRVSCFRLGDHVVWGMTERILLDFLAVLERSG